MGTELFYAVPLITWLAVFSEPIKHSGCALPTSSIFQNLFTAMVPSCRTWNTTKSQSYLQCVRSHLLRVTDFHVYEMNYYSPLECMHAHICLSAYVFCLPILFLQPATLYTEVVFRMYGFCLGSKSSWNAKAPKTSFFLLKKGEQAHPPHVCSMLSYKNPTKGCYCLRFLLLLTSESEMRGFCSDSCGSWQ